MGELVRAAQEYQEAVDKARKAGILDSFSQGVLIINEVFDDTFKDYEVKYEGPQKQFPYCKTANLNGVTFFALYTESELSEDDKLLLKGVEVEGGNDKD